MRHITVVASALIVLYAGPQSAFAADKADFYKGKQISAVTGTGPVGTYAQYTRLLVSHLSKYIPGNPTMVFQTMPGAGGLIATNHAYNLAPRDGTYLLVVGQNYALDQALGLSGVRYDARRFNIIGRFTDNTTISLGWRAAGVTSAAVLHEREVVTAGIGPASPTNTMPKLLNAIAKTRFKLISGYKGLDELMLAMQRGEATSMVTSLQSLDNLFQSIMQENKVSVLAQYSPRRHPKIPDVPTAAELGLSEEGRRVANFVGSAAEIGRMVIAPPDVPAEQVQILRAAFDSMLKDAQFRADVAKQHLDLNPISVKELEDVVNETLNASPSVIETARQILDMK